MDTADLVVRNAVLANSTRLNFDLVISEGEVVSVEKKFPGSGAEEIDATNLHVFPAVIDPHVHLNEPGRTDWEGFETGSRALAAGGVTLFFDMPLNAHPPTIDAESFQKKLTAAQAKSLIDFAFWGGIVPGNLDKLEELADCGVIGFKAFMSDSGIDDFLRVDDDILRRAMKIATELDLPVAVHAESEAMTKKLALERITKGQTTIRDYLQSRPIEAEVDAIHRAIQLAGETGCKLHVVHVSSAEGLIKIAEAQKRGVNVSCETCAHYLALTEEDVEKLGAVAKCAPPLRSPKDQERLWQQVIKSERTLTIGSDHSPAPPEMKTDSNFFKAWGGISGAQHALPVLITEAHFKHGMELWQLWFMLSKNIIRRFKLSLPEPSVPGAWEANFAIVDLEQSQEVRREDLLYRHKQSPYIGRNLRAKVLRTILRGQTIFKDGKIVAKPSGRLVKPLR